MNRFEELEKKILEMDSRKLKLEKMWIKRPDGETLEDFLFKFFTIWNENRNTIYLDTGEVQTPPKKRRSLGDIYHICKYYYPKCTVSDVLDVLVNKLPLRIEKGFRTTHCFFMRKRAYYYNPTKKNIVWDKNQEDEFGNVFAHYENWLQGNFDYEHVTEEDDD